MSFCETFFFPSLGVGEVNFSGKLCTFRKNGEIDSAEIIFYGKIDLAEEYLYFGK